MFDLGRIGDMVGGLFGSGVQETMSSAGVLELLDRAGIDPSALAGLDQAQIIDLLAQHGVDASFLEGVDLAALSEQFGQGEGLQSIADLIGRATER